MYPQFTFVQLAKTAFTYFLQNMIALFDDITGL